MNQHILSHALWTTADPVHKHVSNGVIIDPGTGRPFGERPHILVPDFLSSASDDDHLGRIITPDTDEGRPRYSDVPEPSMVIIPERGEYLRNGDRLRQLENDGAILGW